MTSIDDRRLSSIIGRIYETPDAPERWHDVLRDLADALDAKSGLLRTLDLRGDRAVLSSHHHNLPGELQREYCAGFVASDPYLDALRRLPPGHMVRNDNLVDLDRLRHTGFYRNYLAPLDNHFIVGGFVERADDGRHTILGFHRHRGGTRFDDRELATVRALAPHVRRAMHLSGVLAAERRRAETAESTLDTLAVAALLLDAEGRVVHTNRAGDRLLAHAQGLQLRNGRVAACDPERARELAELIARVRRGAEERRTPLPESLLLPERDGTEANLLAIAMPVRGHRADLRDNWPRARVALYVGDLEDTGLLRPELLRGLYGMTAAEARLAVALARGRDLPELAADWKVSTDTLRTQLKGVFAKTGVRRQAALVRLLAGAPWKLATTIEPTTEVH